MLGNRKLIYRAVRRWMPPSAFADDMVGDCQIVLIQAVAAYNPWMGIRFSTYAFTCLMRALSRLSQRHAADRLSRSLPLESLPDGEPRDDSTEEAARHADGPASTSSCARATTCCRRARSACWCAASASTTRRGRARWSRSAASWACRRSACGRCRPARWASCGRRCWGRGRRVDRDVRPRRASRESAARVAQPGAAELRTVPGSGESDGHPPRGVINLSSFSPTRGSCGDSDRSRANIIRQGGVPQAVAGPTQNEKILFWASFLTLIAAGIGFSVRGAILKDWGQQFGFTQAELGTITGGGLVGFGVAIIFFSFFADRFGYGKLMLVAFLLHASSAVVTFAATPVYNAYGKEAAFWCLNVGHVAVRARATGRARRSSTR